MKSRLTRLGFYADWNAGCALGGLVVGFPDAICGAWLLAAFLLHFADVAERAS